MGFFDTETRAQSETWRAPMTETMPGILSGIDLVTGWMGRPQQFFPGQTYAPMTPDEQAALAQLRATAGAMPGLYEGFLGPATAAYGQALAAPSSVLGMGLQDVANNPYLAGVADVLEERAARRMQEDILPQMEASAVGRGGLGGSRLAIQAQQAQRDSDIALNEALAGLYGQAWQQGLGAETSRFNQAQAGRAAALGQLPAMVGVASPADYLMRAGGMQRLEDQRAIDEEMARFQFSQMEPYERARMGMGALMVPGEAFGRGRSTSEGSTSPSTFQNIGSALMTGGMLGGNIVGMFPTGGGLPYGTPYGGYGQFSTLPTGWGANPYYGTRDPWGGQTNYGLWG